MKENFRDVLRDKMALHTAENAALAAGLRLLYEKYLERHGLTANVIVELDSSRNHVAG